MRKSSMERLGTPIVSGPSGASSDDGGLTARAPAAGATGASGATGVSVAGEACSGFAGSVCASACRCDFGAACGSRRRVRSFVALGRVTVVASWCDAASPEVASVAGAAAGRDVGRGGSAGAGASGLAGAGASGPGSVGGGGSVSPAGSVGVPGSGAASEPPASEPMPRRSASSVPPGAGSDDGGEAPVVSAGAGACATAAPPNRVAYSPVPTTRPTASLCRGDPARLDSPCAASVPRSWGPFADLDLP